MTVRELVYKKCEAARAASHTLAVSDAGTRNDALGAVRRALIENSDRILEANRLDLSLAREAGTRESMIDRLTLTRSRIEAISASVGKLIALPDPLGVGECFTRPNGLMIRRVSVPIGTIGIIYEARPNVTVDAAAICIKTGNCVVLRGSREAFASNRCIAETMREAVASAGLERDCVQFIDDPTRESSTALMTAQGLIDVLIPRGGAGLIRSVCENATVPVIETGAGNCHIYVEKTADMNDAVRIAVNAKVQRPSVCNSAETLLVDRGAAQRFLPLFFEATREWNVQLRGCAQTCEILPQASAASEDDFYTEYNDYIIAVRVVDDVVRAVEHINRYSTGHSEAIITQSARCAEYFTRHVDSAAVYVNASTRFTDGEEFGFGAEIGISTQKLHARGPMGPQQLTSVKYIVTGDGQIRS